MYKYGLRVYYDAEGTPLYQTGNIETTISDFWGINNPMEWNPDLKDRDDIQMVQYGWDEYREEFSTQKLVSIDPETLRPVFGPWPEPDPSTDPPPVPPETELQKAQKQIAELEDRTKLLEYNVQTTGETLDIHEGAIVDVMNLALGGSLREA